MQICRAAGGSLFPSHDFKQRCSFNAPLAPGTRFRAGVGQEYLFSLLYLVSH
uniref:Uncharacterized protein n=1 Tax=Anguilla anguilla TaxID=7936 RepID=A0A0E9R317_ANGAN